jgi:hypothetical protein
MKKVIFYAIAMVFAGTLGVAYAGNGVTDFSGLNYDIGIVPAEVHDSSMEGVNAGGMREAGPGLILDNGVTDFSGRTYDIGPTASLEPTVESAHAGGMREDKRAKELSNGVTDFSGKTYDIE